MVANTIIAGFCLRAGLIVGVLLPFVLILFLLPEPTESELDDYFPSSRARAITVKIVKSLKSLQGENTGASSHDFAVGGFPQCIAMCRTSIDADLHLHLRHFGLLTNRLVRSPPANSL